MVNYISNKKAVFNYQVLKEYEAGLVLAGYEVKAVRLGRGKLEGAHITIRDGEAFLIGASIAVYQAANTPQEYNPERTRKLLLSKKELSELEQKSRQPGLTIIPFRLYNKKRYLKLKIALVRGRKKADKRELMKKRDAKRDLGRILKNQ